MKIEKQHIVKIDQDSFSPYFEKPLKECLSDKKNEISEKIQINIQNVRDIIYYCDDNKDTKYYKCVEKQFINELLEKPAFHTILLLHLFIYIEENKKKFTPKSFVRKKFIEIYKTHINDTRDSFIDKTLIRTDDEKKLKEYLQFLKEQLAKAEKIFGGIKELAKNIIEHSGIESGKGNGTIVVKTTTKNKLLKENIVNKKLWNKYFDAIDALDYCDKSTPTYLDIWVTDSGTNDIIETSIKNLSKKNWRGIPARIRNHDEKIIESKLKDCKSDKNKEAELLFNMYFSGNNSLNLNRQANSSYKGQGIYLFTEFITSNAGFFNLETNSNSSKSTISFSCMHAACKDSIVDKNTILNEEQKIDQKLFGTTYKIILPITNETLYENETIAETSELETTNLAKGVYEKMLPLKKEQIKPKDKEYKNLTFNELEPYNLHKYVIRDYVANENKIFVFSLKNKKQTILPIGIDHTMLYRDIDKIFKRNRTIEAIVINDASQNLIVGLFNMYAAYSKDDFNLNNAGFTFFPAGKMILLLTKDKNGAVIAGKSVDECKKINTYISKNGYFNVPSQVRLTKELDKKEQKA